MTTDKQTENTRRVLIVEDDPQTAQLIKLYLIKSQYDVRVANDGRKGLDMALNDEPDLVLLDVMLPEMDGMEVCRRVREESAVPIIMVTARIDEEDKLEGLGIGADDYISKPFSPREVVARVQAVLRRIEATSKRHGASKIGKLSAKGVEVGLDSRIVTINGEEVDMTPTEFRILSYLMEYAGNIMSRDQIMINAFGYDYEGLDRTIDTHISNLRNKLEKRGVESKTIQTVYGMGYRFNK